MADHDPTSVDEEFIRRSAKWFQDCEKRSLVGMIDDWFGSSSICAPAVLISTDALFPRFGQIEPRAARFLPEVYACIDQLLIALTHAAAELHEASQARENSEERTRIVAVSEIIKCIATHVYAIRVLATTGFDVQVRQIVRTYVEYVELLALVCADTGALDEFVASGESGQANEFWHRHISKFKARKKRLVNSVLKADLPPETEEQSREWNDRENRLLSECAHPTIGSVLRSGRITYDPAIVPDDHEDVIGSLMYTFCAFADALELTTLEFVKANTARSEESNKPDIHMRFCLLVVLAVMLGYRKDYVLLDRSSVEEDLNITLKHKTTEKAG